MITFAVMQSVGVVENCFVCYHFRPFWSHALSSLFSVFFPFISLASMRSSVHSFIRFLLFTFIQPHPSVNARWECRKGGGGVFFLRPSLLFLSLSSLYVCSSSNTHTHTHTHFLPCAGMCPTNAKAWAILATILSLFSVCMILSHI